MKKNYCILCGSHEVIRELYPATFTEKDLHPRRFSARQPPEHIHFRIVECTNCGMQFSDPIIDREKIDRLYRDSFCSYDSLLPFVTKTYLSLLSLLPNNESKSKLLDIGCGNGFFLNAAHALFGYTKLYGVEPSTPMVQSATKKPKKQFVTDIFRPKLFPASTFDIVTCFHTIDHLPDPGEFVSEVKQILKSGGYVVIVAHDTSGLSARFVGEASPIYDIEHMHLFSQRTIRVLFERAGFKTMRVGSLWNQYPVWYWITMCGLPKAVKALLNWIVTILGLKQKTVSFPGGNLYYIGQKL